MHKGKMHQGSKAMCPGCGAIFSKAYGSGIEVCNACQKKYGMSSYG